LAIEKYVIAKKNSTSISDFFKQGNFEILKEIDLYTQI
jgi:hypothetical protein